MSVQKVLVDFWTKFAVTDTVHTLQDNYLVVSWDLRKHNLTCSLEIEGHCDQKEWEQISEISISECECCYNTNRMTALHGLQKNTQFTYKYGSIDGKMLTKHANRQRNMYL